MIGNETDLVKYAGDRGTTIAPEQAKIALFKASDYLNNMRWLGQVAVVGQDDSWPRTGIDLDGVAMVTADGVPIPPTTEPLPEGAIPRAVMTAAYRLATDSAGGIDLLPSHAGGAQIIRERIEGAIDTTYAESTIGNAPSFPWVDALLGSLLVNGTNSFGANCRMYRG